MDFSFAELTSFRKILDMHNRTTDSGFYTLSRLGLLRRHSRA